MLLSCGAAAIVSVKWASAGSPFWRGGMETSNAAASINAADASGVASLPLNTKASTLCPPIPAPAMAAAFSRVVTVPTMRSNLPPNSAMKCEAE